MAALRRAGPFAFCSADVKGDLPLDPHIPCTTIVGRIRWLKPAYQCTEA